MTTCMWTVTRILKAAMAGVERLPGQPALQGSDIVCRQAAFARGRNHDFHVARSRRAAEASSRDIDESAPPPAGSNDRQHVCAIKPGRDILPTVKRDAIARGEPPEQPMHAAARLRPNRGIAI